MGHLRIVLASLSLYEFSLDHVQVSILQSLVPFRYRISAVYVDLPVVSTSTSNLI